MVCLCSCHQTIVTTAQSQVAKAHYSWSRKILSQVLIKPRYLSCQMNYSSPMGSFEGKIQ